MSQATAYLQESEPLKINFDPMIDFSGESFFAFCQLNKGLRIERDSEGGLTIMAPTGGETGRKNASISAHLWYWADQDQTGITFDSSTGFILPNGAVRSPDAAWVSKHRYQRLEPNQRNQFVPLCPDFVIELRSSVDRLPLLEQKMEEYMAQGVSLGWLLDPFSQVVAIYRQGLPPQLLHKPHLISGDPELPGFSLPMDELW